MRRLAHGLASRRTLMPSEARAIAKYLSAFANQQDGRRRERAGAVVRDMKRTREQVLELRGQGSMIHDIVAKLGVSRATVFRILNDAGLASQ